MSIDNENEALENENQAGVATAPTLGDLDKAMAALIRAASPPENPQGQDSSKSGPAMAVQSISMMEDDDDDFFNEIDQQAQEAVAATGPSNGGQEQPAAPAHHSSPAAPPAPIPFYPPQSAAQHNQAPQAPAPEAPAYVPAPVPMQQQHHAPQQQPPAPAPAPAQPAYVEQPVAAAPAPPPVPAPALVQQQPQPVAPVQEPEPVHYAQPAPAVEPSPPQPRVTTPMQETMQQPKQETISSDDHLVDASIYIGEWLAENLNNEEVIEAAMDWVKTHKSAEHSGHVLANLLLVQDGNHDLTLIAVRWLTQYSMHPLAPQVVSGLRNRR